MPKRKATGRLSGPGPGRMGGRDPYRCPRLAHRRRSSSGPGRQEVFCSMAQAAADFHGEQEALRFRWIESEKPGHDLGEAAIRRWVRCHWRGYLRARWLEHLQGKRFWVELD